MRTTLAGGAARRPRPATPERPAARRSRGELAAWLAALAVVAQLVLLPVAAITAAVLILIGRLSRWRLHWLLLPALGAACWLSVSSWPAGLPAEVLHAHGTAAGSGGWAVLPHLVAQSARLARLAAGVAAQPDRLLHPAAALHTAFAGTGRWLPVYLLAATGEAAIVLWLGWRRAPPEWRSGLVATHRRLAAARALAAGRTVTTEGCALGVDVSAGRLAGISWAAARRGILLTGPDHEQLTWPALAAVCAAMRRRQTVLVLDVGDGSGRASDGCAAAGDGGTGTRVARRVTALAANLGVIATELALPAGGLPAGELERVIGRAIRHREVVAVTVGAVREVPGPATHSAEGAQHGANARAAVQALTSVLASLRDLGLRADCLTWIAGCETVEDETLRVLMALAPETGTAVLLSAVRPATGWPANGLPTSAWPTSAWPSTAWPSTGLAGHVLVAEPVPGSFAMYRTDPRPARQIIATAPLELAAVRLS